MSTARVLSCLACVLLLALSVMADSSALSDHVALHSGSKKGADTDCTVARWRHEVRHVTPLLCPHLPAPSPACSPALAHQKPVYADATSARAGGRVLLSFALSSDVRRRDGPTQAPFQCLPAHSYTVGSLAIPFRATGLPLPTGLCAMRRPDTDSETDAACATGIRPSTVPSARPLTAAWTWMPASVPMPSLCCSAALAVRRAMASIHSTQAPHACARAHAHTHTWHTHTHTHTRGISRTSVADKRALPCCVMTCVRRACCCLRAYAQAT